MSGRRNRAFLLSYVGGPKQYSPLGNKIYLFSCKSVSLFQPSNMGAVKTTLTGSLSASALMGREVSWSQLENNMWSCKGERL